MAALRQRDLKVPSLSVQALLWIVVFGGSLLHSASAAGDSAGSTVEAAEYSRTVVPFVREFCLECHSGTHPEGQLDLERFNSLDRVQDDLKTWRKVVEKLAKGEMPPEDAPQPSQRQRQQLMRWGRTFMDAQIVASAGDPGQVVLRRLSHAEYNYTVRDLTGIDLRPTRDFPVDGAAGEGFTNTGQALVMSPGLLNKYFEAAKMMSSHVVLLPDGIRFSPHATRREWTNAIMAEIQALYGQFVDQEGRVALEPYVTATLHHRDAIRAGSLLLSEIAATERINARYLRTVWSALNSTATSIPLDPVRARWRSARPHEATALAAEIDRWRNQLWKTERVGHFQELGEYKAWQHLLMGPGWESNSVGRGARLSRQAQPQDVQFVPFANGQGRHPSRSLRRFEGSADRNLIAVGNRFSGKGLFEQSAGPLTWSAQAELKETRRVCAIRAVRQQGPTV